MESILAASQETVNLVSEAGTVFVNIELSEGLGVKGRLRFGHVLCTSSKFICLKQIGYPEAVYLKPQRCCH